MQYQGSCHCGAVGYTYQTEVPPRDWVLRECQCTFCRAHGACSISDPAGSIEFYARRPERLRRYRFGQRITDFLVCGECGVYVGAMMDAAGTLVAIVNVNALCVPPEGLREPVPTVHDGESVEERTRRRASSWSACRGVGADTEAMPTPR